MKSANGVFRTPIWMSIVPIGLTLCVFSCSKTTEFEKQRKEELVRLERALSEGPSEDECQIDSYHKPRAEKLGPILPAIPYRKMLPFLPEKVGAFSRDRPLPLAPNGFPVLLSVYHADVAGKKRTVRLTLRDNRQANGGLDGQMMEIMLKRVCERDGTDVKGKRNLGRFTVYIQSNFIICAIAGRFAVFVDAECDSKQQIGLQFLKAVDLEKLSQVK